MGLKSWGPSVLGGLTAMIVGGLLAATPHLSMALRTGDFLWTSDYDEFCFYLPLGAKAYEHGLPLRDPATGGPTYYQPLTILPGLALAKSFDGGPLSLGFFWRLSAGIMVGGAWYLLLRHWLSPASAAAVAIILLADAGVFWGQLGYSQIRQVRTAYLGAWDLDGVPHMFMLPQWRIMNPALSLPWWLLFLTLLARAVAHGSRGRILAASVGFGLLFYAYFYSWTTAVVGLMLASAVDWHRWRTYLGTLAGGVCMGLPALVMTAAFRDAHGAEWMHRTDKMIPISHTAELLLPRISIAVLVLLVGWVLRRRQDLRWLVCFTAAALALMNHQLVTGLQIENAHWIYVFGPTLSLLLVLAVADLCSSLGSGRLGKVILWLIAVTELTAAFWLSATGAAVLHQPQQIIAAINHYREQAEPGRTPKADDVVAGDVHYQYAAASHSAARPLAGYTAVLSPILDSDFELRMALNTFLLGRTREDFAADRTVDFTKSHWGPWARSAESRDQKLAAYLRAWDTMAANPDAALKTYDVRYVALPIGAAVPEYFKDKPLIQGGPHWNVWKLEPAK